jgi:hypothetical protein
MGETHMKTLISVVLALFVVAGMNAQDSFRPDVKYVAKTLSAGTVMSARTVATSTSLDDTTQTISLTGFAKVYVHLVTAGNDSAGVLLAYSVSDDGATFGAYTLFDSLSTTGTVGANKAYELPAGAMGGSYVRIRTYGSEIGRTSANPVTTLKTIIRKKYQ